MYSPQIPKEFIKMNSFKPIVFLVEPLLCEFIIDGVSAFIRALALGMAITLGNLCPMEFMLTY